MKRNHAMRLFLVMGFFVLILAATNSVVANPGLTSECGMSGGCHETHGTLTLTTNSTVDAETSVPFVLQIEAGNGAEYIAIKSDWENNNFFTISESLVQDDSPDDTNASNGEISVEITFTPLSNGTYTIRIWTVGEAGSDLADSFDVTVTVTGEQGTTPTPPPTTVDLYGIWRMMLLWVPGATAVILVIFGYLAIRRK
ncbi:MAG: hypothetical protein ACFFBL_12220 [Promethearchaeota archaeon]